MGKPINSITGRQMEFRTSSPRVIREEPGQLDKPRWGPRADLPMAVANLSGRQRARLILILRYFNEVEKGWTKLGSKNRKKEHKVVGGMLRWRKFVAS